MEDVQKIDGFQRDINRLKMEAVKWETHLTQSETDVATLEAELKKSDMTFSTEEELTASLEKLKQDLEEKEKLIEASLTSGNQVIQEVNSAVVGK